MSVTVTVQGIPDFVAALQSIVPKLRRRALLNALKAGARVVQAQARNDVPVLSSNLQSPYRKPGTVKNAIAVRTSKIARAAGDVGVFVNVKPAAGAKFTGPIGARKFKSASKRGANSPDDPFYWRFLEFGTKNMPARPFLRPAAQKLDQALTVFETVLGPQIQRLDTNPKDPL